MKTIWNLRSYSKLLFALLVLSFFGCKDSEDPDPRQAFVGTYEMDDFDVNVRTGTSTVDTTFLLANSSEIDFLMDEELDADELQVELEEFLEDVMLGSLKVFTSSGITIAIDAEEVPVVEVSNDEFELKGYDYMLNLTDGGSTQIYPCEVEGEGVLEGDELSFEFVITIFAGGSTVTFEGTIAGERD